MVFAHIALPMLKDYLFMKDLNIYVYYKGADLDHGKFTLLSLKSAYDNLSSYLSFNIEKPVRAILVPDRKEYERLVTDLLGVNIEIPSNPGRIAQPQRTDIVFLSPSAYKDHSIYTYNARQFSMMICHELIHVFEEAMSPDIEAMPRWWSEGLAVYLSGQWKYDDQFNFRKPALSGIKDGNIPDLFDIDDSIDMSYEWGWTIIMFIEAFFSKELIINIIKKCHDGDIIKLLGMSYESFEHRYKDFLLGSDKDQIINISPK